MHKNYGFNINLILNLFKREEKGIKLLLNMKKKTDVFFHFFQSLLEAALLASRNSVFEGVRKVGKYPKTKL